MSNWGTIGNRLLYDFLNEHEKDWNTRENFVRDMNPKIRNTIVELKKYKKKKEKINDYYDEIISRRKDVTIRENTNWRLDVERDEGGIFLKLR